MRRAEWLQETRLMRFEEPYSGWTESRLTQEEAALLLGVCARTFRRYIDRYKDEGLNGLIDKRRGPQRQRKPLPGMMIHQDASTYAWVPGSMWDLIVTMDDATSKIYSMFFVEEEGTWSSLQGVRETLKTNGLFSYRIIML